MNSIMYALIASALNWYFSIPRWLNTKANRPFTLRTQIFTILTVSLILSITAISLLKTHRSQQEYLGFVKKLLQMNADRIAGQLDYFLNSNKLVIQNEAKVLSLSESAHLTWPQKLNEFHQVNLDFSSIIMTKVDGEVVFSSPVVEFPLMITGNRQRDQFISAKHREGFISQAFRAYDSELSPVAAISAPVTSPDNDEVLGILEGTLELDDLKNIVEDSYQGKNNKLKQQILITDGMRQVVFTTNGVIAEVMQAVDWVESESSNISGFSNSPYFENEIISQVSILPNDWQVISVYSVIDFTKVARQEYRHLVVVLIIFMILAALLAAFLSSQINGPINRLIKRTISLNVSGNKVEPVEISPYVPLELVTLMRAQESAEKRLRLAFEGEKLHQLKRANAEKENEAKSDFLSSMSHELRTPLNAISGFSQLLLLDKSLNEEPHELANEINVASQYLILLINDLLDMSKIESGKLQLNMEKLNLVEFIEQILPLVENQTVSRHISLDFVKPQRNLEVVADKLRLKQVVLNLLSNAIKYNRSNGRVIITIQVNNDQSRMLKISDNGVGIAPDRLDELFQPFCRLDKENSNIIGHGVGLSVSKKLVELMGGRIEVQSKQDKGSCFSVILPPASCDEHTLRPSATDNSGQLVQHIKRCRILYVEDNDVNALVMCRAMQKFPQIDYCWEPSGRLALQRLQYEFFDFVLLDITLTDMTGYDILAKLQSELASQYKHVFAVSANAMNEDREKGLATGFDEYVTKPVIFQQLFELISNYQQRDESLGSTIP